MTGADLDGREYADALVSDRQCPGRASITYNLGRDWKRFRATVGVDDDSTESAATLTIHGDDTVLSKNALAVGKPRELNLRVENMLRLTISYSFEGCYLPDTWVVLADPTLS
ncbi:NPCBM/NEW2 domain-containing protein [Streptomyces roseirectus]|uniref:NPCBM/NEW2 domain-containing protein n=1 Tax=Streptomyces roseirectus TaxID=2768066 RepID=A0A7H0IHB1_9ACTN|nr:NPCBM/NEW2 domain-containing protein [Streptomyces roseirectus]QNP72177.1 NPCBM/NEW2 domain-containing protein [Streptomyces roseirectus]